ncbi:ATP-binding protein [Zooshikella marina]|uniref:ATP-binding protein n=1 Tax=Zooshikella ganghwensis TaxID=202772 RepID=UPI001BAF1646|nr:AAA family ATPase [Zooshikella ganghwensis]MBU2707536.1 ATP-binding protein [Zooshikella ganghwensis]
MKSTILQSLEKILYSIVYIFQKDGEVPSILIDSYDRVINDLTEVNVLKERFDLSNDIIRIMGYLLIYQKSDAFKELCKTVVSIKKLKEQKFLRSNSLEVVSSILDISELVSISNDSDALKYRLFYNSNGYCFDSKSELVLSDSIAQFVINPQKNIIDLHEITNSAHISGKNQFHILPVSHKKIADDIALNINSLNFDHALLVMEGVNTDEKYRIAQHAFKEVGLSLVNLDALKLIDKLQKEKYLFDVLNRESRLHKIQYFLDLSLLSTLDLKEKECLINFLSNVESTVCIAVLKSYDFVNEISRSLGLKKYTINFPTKNEQIRYWREVLNTVDIKLADTIITKLGFQYDLNFSEISHLVDMLVRSISISKSNDDFLNKPEEELQNLCRDHCRVSVGNVAQIKTPESCELKRINDMRLSSVVLPEKQKELLYMFIGQINNRATVFHKWGFAESKNSPCTSALFYGSSGTGKSYAAQIIAAETGLDLYHININNIVDKYIGETEKKLEMLFSAAEKSSSILLFDEADSLFGKRTRVERSQDKYANTGVSYLLQRMESYTGICILTTNLRQSVDSAFERRLNFIIEFPFPQLSEREAIWRNIFPDKTPLDLVDYKKLSRLPFSGGMIRSTALTASFNAALSNESIGMKHILKAAQFEFAKVEKSISPSLYVDW